MMTRRINALAAALGLALPLAMTLTLTMTVGAALAATNPPDELPLFVGQPAPGLSLTVVDMEAELPYRGKALQIPKPANPRVPASRLRASPLPLDGGGQGVLLQYQDSWLTALRIDADTPLDLRPYLAQGTLEFEVRSPDLSHSGINIAMACGPGCSRLVNHVLPSRALAGRGWQRLSFALRCFDRDGADFSAVKRPFSLESSGTAELAIAHVRIRRQGTPNTTCPDHRSQSVTPAPLEEVWSLDWWQPRHAQKLTDIQRLVAAGTPPRLVFIGDSITHGWEDVGKPAWDAHFARYQALGLGYGGDRTENVLWRLQHGELDGYSAELVVLMIGTNNTGHRQEDPATTAAGIQRILAEIQQRQPQARVLLLAIFPRDKQPDSPLRRINQQVNQRIASLADGQRVLFQDIHAALMNADGTLSEDILPDLLHLSPAGYARWAEQIAPTVARLLTP